MTTVKCHCTYISNSIDCVDIFNSKCTSGKHSTSQGQRHGYYCHGHNTFWHAMATNGFYHSTFQSVLLPLPPVSNECQYINRIYQAFSSATFFFACLFIVFQQFFSCSGRRFDPTFCALNSAAMTAHVSSLA